MSDNVFFLQLNNHVKPKIEEVKSKGYVLNGKNNSYFEEVNNRYIGSPTNSAINNGYRRMIYGKGLSARNASTNTAQYIDLKTKISQQDVKKIVSDFQIQGMAYLQIIENKDGTLSSVSHISVDKLAPSIADEDLNINSYWISNDWSKPRGVNEPEEIPAFDPTKKQPISIYAIKPYMMGMEYFTLPSYQSGLQYAELEEEISNFSVKHIKNGLSFGYVVNVPDGFNLDDDAKKRIKSEIKKNLTGSNNAGNFVVNFANGDAKITVEVVQINDAHKQWQFLTTQSREQIITAHEVVSPMLFGIKDANGFSSNADELEEAQKQTYLRVITPKQDEILEAFQFVINSYGYNLDLYFIPLSTIENSNVNMNSQKVCCSKEDGLTGEFADLLINKGEYFDTEEWHILCEDEVDYESDHYAHEMIKLASTGTARPNANSKEQDSEDIAIRYRYVGNPSPQREFCIKMMQADKRYRKEDIILMNSQEVNPGHGIKGANTYNIWLYKGGVNCNHKWNRVIYLKRNGSVDVNSPLAKTISTSEARRRGYNVPSNDNLVSITPNNMPNGGAYQG